MTALTLDEFTNIPKEKIADIVRSFGRQVCVFPFNGTRRWFLLEHAHKHFDNSMEAYNDLTGKRYIEMFQMMFDHGIDTVLAPVFGGDIMERGSEYMEHIGAAMSRLVEHPDFTSFYNKYDVRVRFYGDYRKKFHGSNYSYLSDLFDKVAKDTAHHSGFRLFYGVFANDATETVAEFSIQYFQRNSRPPSKREIIELYYGEYIDKADIFIGFEKFSTFDYPLLNLGDESIYFTVSPSLFMTERQFRNILYDHIYLRPCEEPDYSEMSAENFSAMRSFYIENREAVLGVGTIRDGIWYEANMKGPR